MLSCTSIPPCPFGIARLADETQALGDWLTCVSTAPSGRRNVNWKWSPSSTLGTTTSIPP
jgi:hypothetical protein